MFFKTPVLFIIFNRLETTMKVFQAIKIYQPDHLYIASDGPRDERTGETQIVENIRKKVLDSIDWKCDVKTLFREQNVGCGQGVSEAITWFFKNEKMGIILEDDCLPSTPFFTYCESLLKKYINEPRVWIIGGRSFHSGTRFFNNKDYLFSHYANTWGWATWKRCWDFFDPYCINHIEHFFKEGGFKNVFFSKIEGAFFNYKYKKLGKDKKLFFHVWDYQFVFQMLINSGLCVVPAKNLIENIGYVGTHFAKKNKLHELIAENKFIVQKEPISILPDREYEKYHFYKDKLVRLLIKMQL